MLPEVPLLLEPEYPPPDPPRAFAKERVGTPIRDSMIVAAMSFVVVKTHFLSYGGRESIRNGSSS
jgi:hypothetical protein